jgi:osmotically-inducible protein OsmY
MKRDATHNVLVSDQDLCRRIDTFLATGSLPGLRNLGVEVDDGTVTLHGTVRTFYEKQMATSCCNRVAGVQRVDNRVNVIGLPSRVDAASFHPH